MPWGLPPLVCAESHHPPTSSAAACAHQLWLGGQVVILRHPSSVVSDSKCLWLGVVNCPVQLHCRFTDIHFSSLSFAAVEELLR